MILQINQKFLSVLNLKVAISWYYTQTNGSVNHKGLALDTLFHARTVRVVFEDFGIFGFWVCPILYQTNITNMRQDQEPGAVSEDRHVTAQLLRDEDFKSNV